MFVSYTLQMRNTKKVSVWPVALVGDLRYESPVVVRGKVYTNFEPEYFRTHKKHFVGFVVMKHSKPPEFLF